MPFFRTRYEIGACPYGIELIGNRLRLFEQHKRLFQELRDIFSGIFRLLHLCDQPCGAAQQRCVGSNHFISLKYLLSGTDLQPKPKAGCEKLEYLESMQRLRRSLVVSQP